MLKIELYRTGQAAAASHTGALTGSNAVIEAALARAGALSVKSIEEMVDLAVALSVVPASLLPQNDAVTLVAASGGFGVMMADAMVEAGLHLPDLGEQTQNRIRDAVPVAGTRNPVDATAQMSSRPDILYKLLTALLEDESRSSLVLLLSLSLFNPRLSGVYQEALAQIRANYPDRLVVLIGQGPAEVTEAIQKSGVPMFATIDAAAKGLAGMVRVGQALARPRAAAVVQPAAAQQLDQQVFQNEFHAKRLFWRSRASRCRPNKWCKAPRLPLLRPSRSAFPVVFKIASEDIPHKTEVGGVLLNIRSREEALAAYDELLARVLAKAPQAHRRRAGGAHDWRRGRDDHRRLARIQR